MVEKDQRRENGRTAGDEVAKEASQEFDKQLSPELPDERKLKFTSPGFARMRVAWSGQDRETIAMVTTTVDRKLGETFSSAFSVMWALYEVVREPETNTDGEVVTDVLGVPQWRKDHNGEYVEDWAKLTGRQRERFLFQITTRLFEWEQLAANAWGEAMLSKAKWEDSFSIGYESLPGNKTIEARTARGNLEAREDRYFAVYCTLYSRKADALVRTMQLLGQRLKDVHSL